MKLAQTATTNLLLPLLLLLLLLPLGALIVSDASCLPTADLHCIITLVPASASLSLHAPSIQLFIFTNQLTNTFASNASYRAYLCSL